MEVPNVNGFVSRTGQMGLQEACGSFVWLLFKRIALRAVRRIKRDTQTIGPAPTQHINWIGTINSDLGTPLQHKRAQQHDINLNDASANQGSAKNKRRQAYRRGQLGKAYASQISPDALDCKPYYRNAKDLGFELYPQIPQVNNHYTRKPTPEELEAAYTAIRQPGWKLFDKGLDIMFDGDTKDSRIIAIVEFVEWDKMSDELKEEVEHMSQFLVKSKQFVNPIPSRGWGGSMWALGWRKAMVKGEIIGQYIKQVAVDAAPALFHQLFDSSSGVSTILGKMFKHMGRLPFQNNQEIMKTNSIPDFTNLMFTDSKTKATGSPHLTFTTNGFYNPPHEDKKDKSDFAFVLFIPTFKATGELAGPADGYCIKSGPFLFPKHKVGIDFSQTNGIVRMIWRAKNYEHCTLPHKDHAKFTRLALSLQINTNISNACTRYQDGSPTGTNIGDHEHYLAKAANKKTK
ncbi:hypothetical protein PSHT_01658 [Puccinia striiformis]|uniref:Tet-like 2OG-Fe(II) oxygenase domain-containing protein n=1 Tax=Puccinia striiformis TaxID=27350 RepID=A0A2S4WJX8_9BASI|nr:hypothetical protein PSHT_01658 [Puccinia striiformis]